MKLEEFIEDIKLKLTGGVIELEISDEIIKKFILTSFKEINRYIDETRLIEVPFAGCIDLSGFKYVSITNVYRTEMVGDTDVSMTTPIDPMYAQTWMVFNNNATYNLNQYMLNYASYETYLQLRNTMSTDLAFKVDKQANKLYINTSLGVPKKITIEYIPIFDSVEEICTPYWIDILQRMSLAHTKVGLGIIRTRFKQTNALWEQDGESMRQEGLTELKELRDMLTANDALFFPVD